MPQFETVLTTGEVHFFTETLLPLFPKMLDAEFTPDGSYAVRARISAFDQPLADLVASRLLFMRRQRMQLETAYSLRSARRPLPRVNLDVDADL